MRARSQAPRSNPSRHAKEEWIAPSLALLAMTSKYEFAIPRRDAPEFVLEFLAQKTRAWGMPGARCTRSLVCSVLVAHECRHHGRTGTPGIPARNGFNGFLRTLPGDRAFLSPSPALVLADLAPASRRQDHTTSPSASAPFVNQRCRVHRIPSPTSVTIAKRPSVGRDGWRYRSDLGQAGIEIFLQPGLDSPTARRANQCVACHSARRCVSIPKLL
jgi:hypothetical protein